MNAHSRQFQAESVAHVAADMMGTIWYWDSAAERLFGWPARIALGQNVLELIVPLQARSDLAAICARAADGHVGTGSVPFRRRDGEEFLVDVTHTPIQGVNGKVIGVVGAHQLAAPPVDSVARWEPDERPTTAGGPLTARESEVVKYVAEGLTNQQIGIVMGISGGVVSNYIDRIFKKLNFNRRAQLAAWAVDHGLWRPEVDRR